MHHIEESQHSGTAFQPGIVSYHVYTCPSLLGSGMGWSSHGTLRLVTERWGKVDTVWTSGL